MSSLEQDTSKKGQVDENKTDLDAGNDKDGEYEVETICDIAVYARESESGYLPRLYYLVSGKSCLEEENTWKPALAI